MNLRQLKKLYTNNGVLLPLRRKSDKLAAHKLLRRLNAKEGKLRFEDGRVFLITHSVVIDLRRHVNPTLDQSMVVLHGRKSKGFHHHNMRRGIGKKMRLNESPLEAAMRCAREKAFITDPLFFQAVPQLSSTEPLRPISGIPCHFEISIQYFFIASFPGKYKPEYTIKRPGKQPIHLGWVPVSMKL